LTSRGADGYVDCLKLAGAEDNRKRAYKGKKKGRSWTEEDFGGTWEEEFSSPRKGFEGTDSSAGCDHDCYQTVWRLRGKSESGGRSAGGFIRDLIEGRNRKGMLSTPTKGKGNKISFPRERRQRPRRKRKGTACAPGN